MPALLTRPWRAPKRLVAVCTAAVQSCHREMSHSIGTISPFTPCRRAVSSTSFMASALEARSAAPTRAPVDASASVMARPMPRAAPVTMTAMFAGAGIWLLPFARQPIYHAAVGVQGRKAEWISHSRPSRRRSATRSSSICARFRRRLLARQGPRRRLPARFPPRLRRRRLARHLHAAGLRRRGPRRHRSRADDADHRRVRRRHVGRLGAAHEHLRAQSGGGVRQRRAEAAHAAAADRRARTRPASR